MKLIYRGVTYDYTPDRANTQATAEVPAPEAHRAYNLRYRGANYALDLGETAKRSIFHPIARLMYRGAAYSLNG
ncbi:MAG: DUF4278 domain-containing protein [Leptolyngbyaceae cyanobacterium HOT.MB2.61]|jgi:hypothetical protein|nr:DUF4278 domain-containing protein [Leptolyngbyaceae cyanobacterium HOT.MB2.61]